MKARFIFGFILLILVLIGIFVGLPYAIQSLKSGSFALPFSLPSSNYFFGQPQISTSIPAMPTGRQATQQTAKKISISSVSRYGQNAISLRASYFDSGKINITGWRIKSVQKGETVIGKGYALPQVDAMLSDVLLTSGESADIIIGLSPLAGNFRVNNCFGWLNNLYNLDYSTDYCPGGFKIGDLAGLDSACQDLILRASSCQTLSENELNKSSYQCRQWAGKNMNYNTCVASYRNDGDFYKEWKIYTGNINPIFDSLHDIIELRDQNGILIDSYEY